MPADEAVSGTSIVALVVSHGTRDETVRCVAALLASEGVVPRVVVIDNASVDGSADAVATAFAEVQLVRSPTNVGFGRANNLGLAAAGGSDYVLLVNSDCFVGPRTLASCVAFLEGHPDASAVACQLRHADGTVQRSCRRFPGLAGEVLRVVAPFQVLRHIPVAGAYYYGGWRHDTTREVEQPAAAYLLVRTAAWGEGPLFDPRFFMYYEDVDLCRRLWRHGPIWFLASVSAVHLGEQSSGKRRASMAAALAVSRGAYFAKWHGTRAAVAASLVGAIGSVARAIAWETLALVSRTPSPGPSGGRARARAHWAAARAGARAAVARDG